MPVDLSASIYAQYQRARKRADEATQRSNWASAAAATRHCAALMRQYAAFASDPGIRQRRLEKAKAYETALNNLKGASSSQRAVEQGGGSDDYYAEAVAHIRRSTITWEDVGGLEETKRDIKTAYGLALAQKPLGVQLMGWRNVLFYGPPGAGKTLLAAATSNGLDATFFSTKVSDVLSKYFGESSRLISALYMAARRHSPAVIFLDEFEALTPQRGHGDSGAERRIVSTLLAELDGLASKDAPTYILTIAATNLPWLIDKAVLSRFEKKVYIPLPDEKAREAVLGLQLEKRGHVTETGVAELVRRTAGYSGREIERLCKVAINRMIERANPALAQRVEQGREAVAGYQVLCEPLTTEDFRVAFEQVRPETTPAELERYNRWQRQADD